jgi:site-specific DNA-cytosine methylase
LNKAVGVHVFAGGFTHGVKKAFDVPCQLETHGFGKETCEQIFDTEFINCDKAEDWPEIDVPFVYGNPRCTGFSTITSGYDETCHGAWAKQTQDIHDLCGYAAGRADVVIWESVQQAFTVGRPLLDYLRDEIFVPKGYRIAHVFVNAMSFGNTQKRRRYFFVAYRNDKNFNITPPRISPYYNTAFDALWPLKDNETWEMPPGDEEYDFNAYWRLSESEKFVVPNLPNGWCMNAMARYGFNYLHQRDKDVWTFRRSDMPFSLHCIHRLNWLRPYPTIHSSCGRQIHPRFNRPVTVGEVATVMGWDGLIPVGKFPFAQIAKGVSPMVGTWLAEQAQDYLDDKWGQDDWESSFNHHTGVWEGQSCPGQVEKVFNLTNYVGSRLDEERYHELQEFQEHRFDVAAHDRLLLKG